MKSSPSSPRSEPPKVHSKLGPSKAGRWLLCRASVGFIERNSKRLPPDKPSSYAKEGSAAHDLAEKLLKGKKAKVDDGEMQDHIELFTRFVAEEIKKVPKGKLFVEQTIPLYYDRKQVGTADVVILSDGTIILIDLKYGEGVSVEAIRNPQLAIYFKSWVVEKKLKLKPGTKVMLVIYQPRAQDGRFVRRWDTTWGEVNEFCEDIAETAESILMDPVNQPFYPDEDKTCRWCPAKSLCPSYAGHLLGELPSGVEQSLELAEPALSSKACTFPKASSLTDDQLSRVIAGRPALEDWLAEVASYAQQRMDKGHPVAGTKVVLGRGSRDWTDEKLAFRMLRRFIPREEVMVKSLLSPAQAEKRLKGKLRRAFTPRAETRLQSLIVKSLGKAVLVHESDPRPAIGEKITTSVKIQHALL